MKNILTNMPLPDKCFGNSIVLFDGVCVLCSASVRFITRFDRKKQFRFAPIQSEAGKQILSAIKIPAGSQATIIFIENGQYYFRSTAVLKIIRRLSGLWPLLYFLVIIPVPLRDFFYNFVAAKRYQLFGKYNECMIPGENIKNRFIDNNYSKNH